MITKILTSSLLFAICRAKPQFQLTQKQAQLSELKTCVPVTPLLPGKDYLNTLHDTLNILKVYDCPIQQQVPPVVVQKEPDGRSSISGTVVGIKFLLNRHNFY